MTVTSFMRKIPRDARITHRQRELMMYLADYEKKNGIAPTVREMTLALGLSSKGSVHVMVNRLIRKGLLKRDHKAVRGVHLR